jgi:hypothetical protein
MHVFLALEIFIITLAVLCTALVPVALRHDLGLARRVVRMDGIPRARWPNLLTRAGMACLLASFVLLAIACYFILAGASN